MKKINWKRIGKTIGTIAIAVLIAASSYFVGYFYGKQTRKLTLAETKVIWSLAEAKGKAEYAVHDFFNR